MKSPPMDPCSCSNVGCSNYLEINRTIIERTALYTALREWRTSRVQSIVNEAGKKAPAYVVATNRTLRDLVHYRPSNEDELLTMYGVGKDKVGKFGLEILEIVNFEVEISIILLNTFEYLP